MSHPPDVIGYFGTHLTFHLTLCYFISFMSRTKRFYKGSYTQIVLYKKQITVLRFQQMDIERN